MQNISLLLIIVILVAGFAGASWYLYSHYEYWQMEPVPGEKTLLSANPDPEKQYNAFPKVVRINHSDQELNNSILAVWYSGNRHIDSNSDGQIYGALSCDEAETWSDPYLIYDDPQLDCRNIGIVCAPNGTIIIFFAKVDTFKISNKTEAWQDFGYIKSYDGGATWSEFISLIAQGEMQKIGMITGNGYGDPVFWNNSIYIMCYGYPNSSYSETHSGFLLKSDNNGELWQVLNTLSLSSGISTSESDFWNNNEYIFGFTRTQNTDPRYLYFFDSQQPQQKWDHLEITNIQGDCPDILRLTDGRYIVAIRAWGSHFYYLGYFILPENFAELDYITQTSLIESIQLQCLEKSVFGVSHGDLAYPSMILLRDIRVLVIYYDIPAGGVFAKIIDESQI